LQIIIYIYMLCIYVARVLWYPHAYTLSTHESY
jgi:hypothetical protein